MKSALAVQDGGAAAVAVHGRIVPQGYSGKADWSVIKRVREELSIPVIANGDCVDKKSYEAIKEKTGCSLVMIGRKAMTNPAIFEEILEGKKADKVKLFLEYLDLAEEYNVNKVRLVKVHAQHLSKGIVGGSKVRLKLNAINDIESIRNVFLELD